MFSFLGINGDFGRFSLYLKVEHLALFNFSIYTIIRTPPFEEKMKRLTSELSDMFAKSHELEDEIRRKLGAIGYEI